MEKHDYFDTENYTGNHLHVDNWKDELNPFIEAIAWERTDGTMDLFFNDFADEKEFKALFGGKEHQYDEFMGVFICNVKSNEEAYQQFRKWVDEVLNVYRNKGDD
ncbi:hypothetical protein [Paenibacillus sp. Soil522]|uniref:hypothetical protein n=1 Tax=Paenibacillus sp. Soil522 TaxID=1736388 RepID=UPI0006F7C401|nr:hypothetical protein [Paenibacillus sp. Soil522]